MSQHYIVYEIDGTDRPRAVVCGTALQVVLALLPRLEPGVLKRLRCDEIGAIQRRQRDASKVVWTPELEAEAVRQGMSGPADAPRREVAADTPDVWVIDGGILPDDDDEPDEPTTLHEEGRS